MGAKRPKLWMPIARTIFYETKHVIYHLKAVRNTLLLVYKSHTNSQK